MLTGRMFRQSLFPAVCSILTGLVVFFPFPQNVAAQDSLKVTSYDQLVKAIRETRSASQSRIEAAVVQEKVREAWETGKLIDEHILLHKERQNYGAQVMERLSRDLSTDRSEISRMVEFARTYPIRVPAHKLSWSHYQALLALNDPKERDEVAALAEKEAWTRDQVRSEVRKRKPALSSPNDLAGDSKLPESKPGKIKTYRVLKATIGAYKGQHVIDLGFANFFKPEKKLKFQDKDIVMLENGKLKKSEEGVSALFTYRADVLDIIDGDTFRAVIDLGFGVSTLQKLRLRGLDAPELVSAEGKEAKQFLMDQMAKAKGQILIRTLKSDKYDRYLADVFMDGKYLNQELIDEGFAVRVQE